VTAYEGMSDWEDTDASREWSETKYDLSRRWAMAYCFELVESLLRTEP
jgi:hypothetical protein